jgi:hypothetical protein
LGLKKDEPAANSKGNGFGAAAGSELPKDGSNVEFYCVLGNIQSSCDFLIAKSGGEHLQDFHFPVSQGLGKLVQFRGVV